MRRCGNCCLGVAADGVLSVRDLMEARRKMGIVCEFIVQVWLIRALN